MIKLHLFIFLGTLGGILFATQYINDDEVSLSAFSLETAFLVILTTLLSICFKFLRFAILLGDESPRKPIPIHVLFFVTLQFLVIYPFRIGELVRLAVIRHYFGLRQSLVLVGAERFFDLVGISLLIAFFLPLGLQYYPAKLYLLLEMFVGLLFLLLIISLAILFVPRLALMLSSKSPCLLGLNSPFVQSAVRVYSVFLKNLKLVKRKAVTLIAYSLAASCADLIAIGLSVSFVVDVAVSSYIEVLSGKRFASPPGGAALYNVLIISSVISMAVLSLLSLWNRRALLSPNSDLS